MNENEKNLPKCSKQTTKTVAASTRPNLNLEDLLT